MRSETNQKGGERASRNCPQCHRRKIWKDGLRKTNVGVTQRFICGDCGYRFSESSVLSTHQRYSGDRQVGAFLTEAKNLSTVETRKNGLAGATADLKGRVADYIWWLKKEGYAESTIRMRSRILKRLVKLGAHLDDPEHVKETVANRPSWSTSTKANVVDTYDSFMRMLGIQWNPPRYKNDKPLPFIPTEGEIDALIAGCGTKTATLLQLLKETGMRVGEASSLEWTDIDTERQLIHLRKAEKGSNPRIFKASSTLLNMLNSLPNKADTIFGTAKPATMRVTFCTSRKRVAEKLASPRIKRIHFHTFRHWKATVEYHRTKDILHVQTLLGHKSIKNTQIYINLEHAIFNDGAASAYTTRIASTVKGARTLLEAGFEYVTDMDGYRLFRKRK
ncbi:MAG: tyrosine-type recombinase/integrase [Candidatus Bathyarchaeota archaeon]|nr:tyrosine-type recombinase/integrase [Candidatus Bathyarchaeota archaeon]